MQGSRARSAGHSLIEVLIGLCLISTLTVGVAPTAMDMIASARIYVDAHGLAESLMLARSEAVRRNTRVALCQSVAGAQCDPGADWSQGWIVFHDANNNGRVDEGESVLHRVGGVTAGAVRIRGNQPVRTYVSYTSVGQARLTSGAFQAGTFTVCAQGSGDFIGRTVVINSAGRPRVDKAKPSACI